MKKLEGSVNLWGASRNFDSPVIPPMRREEKRRKFNEAVLDVLYPPPLPSQSEEEEDPQSPSPAELKGDPFTDGPGSSSESDNDGEVGGGERKLTRAQRKRIRKKKLRQESALRGEMIGPLNLPPSIKDVESGNVQKDETSYVRRNAQVDSASCEREGEDAAASTKQKRLKHRRVVKRLAKNRPALSNRREDE